VSWRSDLITSDSLQQNTVDAVIDKWTRRLTACMHADGQHFVHFSWASDMTRKESWTNYVKITWFISKKMKKMFLYCWLRDFKVPKVSKGKVCTLNRRGGKITIFRWHILSVMFVTKLLLKLLLMAGWYRFLDTVYITKIYTFTKYNIYNVTHLVFNLFYELRIFRLTSTKKLIRCWASATCETSVTEIIATKAWNAKLHHFSHCSSSTQFGITAHCDPGWLWHVGS